MSHQVTLPDYIRQEGRIYFTRTDIENYKRALAGLPPQESDGPIILVPAPQFAAELGFHRRTLGRRIAEFSGAGDRVINGRKKKPTACDGRLSKGESRYSARAR